MKRRLLSKTRYLNGLQCLKYLWLIFNDKDKIVPPDTSTQHAFDEGHRIGELAKQLFPNGIDIPTDDFSGNLTQTKKLLTADRPLFEPGFYVDSYFSRLRAQVPSFSTFQDYALIIILKSHIAVLRSAKNSGVPSG